MTYIYQKRGWPEFTWNIEELSSKLTTIRHRQGKLLGYMESLGFEQRAQAFLETITTDALKTSEIEGEILNHEQVRSSIARHLEMNITNSVPSTRSIDGLVEMLLDATQNYEAPLTKERLFNWHIALFPPSERNRNKIEVGKWRSGNTGPMRVVSGAYGNENVHFEAPDASQIEKEMQNFLAWFNGKSDIDTVLKAGICHFWFVTIHPFEDGNGRIARAIADMQLARADGSAQRFYSMSAMILQDWKQYFWILEESQKGTLDITPLLFWFLECLNRSLDTTDNLLAKVRNTARFWDKFSKTSLNERQKLMLDKLLDGFEGKLTTVKWAKLAKCSHDTALRDIQDLIEKEILTKEDAGGRSSSYMLKT